MARTEVDAAQGSQATFPGDLLDLLCKPKQGVIDTIHKRIIAYTTVDEENQTVLSFAWLCTFDPKSTLSGFYS